MRHHWPLTALGASLVVLSGCTTYAADTYHARDDGVAYPAYEYRNAYPAYSYPTWDEPGYRDERIRQERLREIERQREAQRELERQREAQRDRYHDRDHGVPAYRDPDGHRGGPWYAPGYQRPNGPDRDPQDERFSNGGRP